MKRLPNLKGGSSSLIYRLGSHDKVMHFRGKALTHPDKEEVYA